MRKLLIVLLLVVMSCLSFYAQDEKNHYIGFKGGVSIPQLSSSQDNELSRDYKSRVAPNFGGFVEIGLTKLKLRFSGADEAKVTKTSTANPEAYQAYLKGRYY